MVFCFIISDTGQSGIINNDQRQELQAHLLSLKQQHQVQQQMLLAQYHDQQMRLQLEQEKQMHEHVKVNVSVNSKCTKYYGYFKNGAFQYVLPP